MDASLKELQTIPGIGKSLSRDLFDLGIRRVRDLKGRDPERLYQAFERLRRRHIDRCVLYAFRCAVYFATGKKHDPALLKWWNWTDERIDGRRKAGPRSARRRV